MRHIAGGMVHIIVGSVVAALILVLVRPALASRYIAVRVLRSRTHIVTIILVRGESIILGRPVAAIVVALLGDGRHLALALALALRLDLGRLGTSLASESSWYHTLLLLLLLARDSTWHWCADII